MSKQPSTEIFSLIKTMTMSEKRHFKLYAARHVIGEENKYALLFDAIEKQKSYDEDALVNSLEFKKHFATLKSRLYEAILNSLDSFHATSSVISQINKQLHFAEILYNKGLYEQCKKPIAKAKELAQKYECMPQLLDIYIWDVRMMHIFTFIKTTEKELHSSFNDALSYLDDIKNTFGNIQLASSFSFKRARLGTTRPDVNYFKAIATNPLFNDEKKATTFLGKYYYHFTRCFYFFSSNNTDEALKEARNAVEQFNKNKHQIREFAGIYGMALYNLAVCYSRKLNYKQALRYIEETKLVCEKHRKTPLNVFLLASSHELGINIHLGKFKRSLILIKKIEEKLEQSTYLEFNSKAIELYLFHNIAVTYFGVEDYYNSKKWVNKILNEKTDAREDLYCISKIFNIIIHYEQGNEELIEYLVKSSARYLYKKKRLLEFESLIINFMQKQLPKIKDKNALKTAFIKLHQDYEALFEKDESSRQLLQYFDFQKWIESKINGKSFATTILSK